MQIRAADPGDLDWILGFLTKKARFDREVGTYDGVIGVNAAFLREALFGPRPQAGCLLAEAEGRPVGFAFYWFRFSSFAGRPSLWLDDLDVDEADRRRGAGTGLVRAAAEVAWGWGCTHLAWNADERNASAVAFYLKLGAALTPPRPHVVTFRLGPEAL